MVSKPKGKLPLGKPEYRCDDITKMDLKECKDVVGKVHPITCHEGTKRE
jgi:hypothetical protein